MLRSPRGSLLELMHGQRLRYAGAIVAMATSIAFLFAVPLVVQAVVDGVLGGGRTWLTVWFDTDTQTQLLAAACLVVALTAVGGAGHYVRGRWAGQASEAIVRRLRDRLYAHIERLPCKWHDDVDTGDLVQRCSSDVETVRAFFAAQVIEIARASLLLCTVVPILFWLDVRMSLVALCLFPLIIAAAVVFFRRVQRLFLAVDEAEGRMTTVLQENLTGIRVVRAFARQDHECAKFGAANGEHRDLHNRLIHLLGAYWSISDILCVGQIGMVLVYGAWWTTQTAFTVGELFAFLQYEFLVIWPVRHMGRVLSETGKAMVALKRLREVLDAEEEAGLGERDPGSMRGEVVVDGLSFAYGSGPPVLRDVSLTIAAGETLALVGPPGSGKSTLVQLMMRLYDYEQGSIRFDGVELASIDRRKIRAQIAAVLQEPFLYSKTLDANIRIGRARATHDEIADSASAACVHEAIEEFEQGYDTIVGEKGVTLSGGQRQRVAIARALLKDPPMLVLDDALSAVDSKTETEILQALRKRRGRRTTIVIAHRLSTIRDADRIAVFEAGAIRQLGTHEELLETDGPYRELWRIQGAFEDELRDDLLTATREQP